MSQSFPAELRQFIKGSLDSLEELEILLLLYKNSARQFSPEAVNQEIRSSLTSIQQRLDSLLRKNLVTMDESASSYRFRNGDQALTDIVSSLEKAYRERRLHVIELLYDPKMDTIKSFAEAFRIKGRKDG